MVKRLSPRGSSKKRAFGALALGSTAVISTAAIAAGASAAVLLFTTVGTNLMDGKSALSILRPVISALSITTVSASGANKIDPALVTISNDRPSIDAGIGGGTDPTSPQPMQLGINVNTLAWYSGTRAFMNLAAGGLWQLMGTGKTISMPQDRLDIDQNVVVLNSGETANLSLSPPNVTYRGLSVDIKCRWTGTGTVSIFGSVARNPRVSGKTLTFTWVPAATRTASLHLQNISGSDPIKNIDCREADADPNLMFDPTFVADVRKYSTVRFLKWMLATENNLTVTWATRTSPRSALLNGPDGVAVEYMVQLANEAGVNPWFTIPWNADDEYIRKFAEYVRDNLDPNLKAYVETSNEVWNWAYKVTSQALDEGRERNLADNDGQRLLFRYAQRSAEVLGIWSQVYQGQMSRLVRVVSTQSVIPWASNQVLGYDNMASKVDALATAPYFSADLKQNPLGSGGLDEFFSTTLPTRMDERNEYARQQRDVAKSFGLRYITYEAGQHVTASTDVDLLTQIQRDPRMGQMYTRYLNYWRNNIGDLMVLFADYGVISQYGGWGQQEYIGQPLSEAPKAQAVDLFRRSYLTSGNSQSSNQPTAVVPSSKNGTAVRN